MAHGAWRLLLMLVCILGPAEAAHAYGLAIPGGARVDLAGGRMDLVDGDLLNAGTFVLGASAIFDSLAFRNFAGATADLGTALLRVRGDFENRGTIVAGSSRIESTCCSERWVSGSKLRSA